MSDSSLPASASTPTPSAITPARSPHQLMLVKQGQRYLFRYRNGEEVQVLEGLAEMARDPQSGLDWFDAAILTHQMGKEFTQRLEALRRPSPGAA